MQLVDFAGPIQLLRALSRGYPSSLSRSGWIAGVHLGSFPNHQMAVILSKNFQKQNTTLSLTKETGKYVQAA